MRTLPLLLLAACAVAPRPNLREAAPIVVDRLSTARTLAATRRQPHYVTFDYGRVQIRVDSNADGAIDESDVTVEDDAPLPEGVRLDRAPAWICFHPTGRVTYPDGYEDPARPDVSLGAGRSAIHIHIHETTGRAESSAPE